MWIVRLALARPYTFIVMALVVILLTPVVLLRTPTDIFPEINIPVISLVWSYNGLSPQDMEQRITSNSERAVTTLVNDVEHIESQSLNGIAVVKIYFQPNANIQTALAQTTAIVQTILRFLPPGTTAPLVAIYSASTVPVIQIGLTSDSLSEQAIFDFGNNFIRTQLATVQGAALPFPYGGKQRQITVDLNSQALQSKGLSPVDIVNAVNAQNLILPTGTAKFDTLEYNVEMNGSPQTIQELNDLPVKTINGATIYMREVAHVRDGFSPQTNIVRANGQRGSLMAVYKTGGGSTLGIVPPVKQTLLDGGQQSAVPALVSTLCICIVFISMFFLSGVARFLFVPLADAVSFAMLASYMWSRTIVPTLAMYLLSSEDEYRADEHQGEMQGFFRRYQQGFEHRFERFCEGYRHALSTALARSTLFAACFLAFCVLSAGLIFVLGPDFFPKVDAGQIRVHFRARTGLRIEETARLADQIDSLIRETIPSDELQTVLDNLGVPYSGLNLSYSNSGTFGTADGEILVQLKEVRGKPTSAYIAALREKFPQRFPGVQFFFQPADIVTQILNFGTPAPIDVAIIGNNQQANFLVAEKLANEMRHIPGAVDVHVQQAFDGPTLHMDIDRTRAQTVGLQARDAAQNALASLSSRLH